MIINDFNYTPRPVFQSYTAYNSNLNKLNYNFLLSDKSPQYYLWNFNTIDNRFPMQADSLLLSNLKYFYNLKQDTNLGLLLKKKDDFAEQTFHQLTNSYEVDYKLFDKHFIKYSGKYPVLLKLYLDSNILGKIYSLSYKPMQINILITDSNDNIHVKRIIPSVSNDGFLIHPFIKNNNDIKHYFNRNAEPIIKDFTITTSENFGRYLFNKFKLKFYEIRNFPLTEISPYSYLIDNNIFNILPSNIQSSFSEELFYDSNDSNLLVHAPSKIMFNVNPHIKRITGFLV